MSAAMTSSNSSLVVLEAVLQKVTQSASGLKSFLENLQSCQHLSHAVHRYVIHCINFLSKMRKTSAYLKAVGAATKVTGGLFAAASVMSHSDLLRKLGSKLWKIGSKVKLGGLAGCVLWEIWNNGFQDTLSAYLESICRLVTDMTIFRTRLEELQTLIPERLDIERLLPMLLLACPQELFLYACCILRLFITEEQFAAFNNFITMAASTFVTSDALPVQLFRETESFNILDSCSSLTASLQILAVLTHVGGEVKSFFSAATSISRQDFVHVKASLSKLWQLSVSFRRSLQNVRMWSS